MRCADCRWFDANADHMEVDNSKPSIGVCMWWTAYRTMTSVFNDIFKCPQRHNAFADDNPKWCNAWEPREVDE